MKSVISFIHSKVARRIFFLFVICALVPLGILALVSLQKMSAKLEAESHERLQLAAKNAGMSVIEGLIMTQSELESMSLATVAGPGRMALRESSAGADKRFHAVSVMPEHAEGRTIPGIPPLLSPAAHTHLADGKTLLLVDADVKADDPIYLATTANRNLSRQGLLVGELNPEHLWNLVGFTLSPGIDICILGPSGNQLYATRPLTTDLVSMILSERNGTSTGEFKWQRDDVDYLVNYWTVFLKPAFLADSWTVVASQSREDSLGPARSFMTTSLLIIFLTLFVVIFTSSVLIRRSLVPLAVLNDGARRLSKGDFDAKVEIASGDEFEDLAISFNEMSEQLGNQFSRLSETGRLFQRILEARDRETIINEVISHYCNSAAHEWIGISLLQGKNSLQLRFAYCIGAKGVPAETVRLEVLLSKEELKSLWMATSGLQINVRKKFGKLLAPMAEEGAGEFLLQPILSKNNLVGVLILGYRRAPNQAREEMVRLRQVADEIAIALDNIRLIEELHWLNRGTVEVLANAVDAKSPWTAGHSQRVTSLSLDIGTAMGLAASDLEILQLSGLFHDIGKIGIPEGILDKPSRLTEEEYAIIREHPRKGAEMLKPIRAYHGAIPIVTQHHEKFGGGGYPLGLAGEKIILGARILAVADVFDALYSKRPYRQGWEIDKVISYLQENAGSNFDPEVVKAFLKIDLKTYFALSAESVRSDPG